MENKRNYYKWQFTSANILEVELIENGYGGGDAGHGGFVTIHIKDISSTCMFVNGEIAKELILTVNGDTERDTLADALLTIALALKKNTRNALAYDSHVEQILP